MALSGHDEEFRRLFAQEAAEHIAVLSQRTLDLEEGAGVDELFRAAHTIKGAASLVGFAPMADVAHALEDLLEGLRAGVREPDPPTVNAILRAVDALDEMLPALLRGEDRVAEANRAEAELRAFMAGEAAGPVADEPEREPEPEAPRKPEPDDPAPTRAPAPAPGGRGGYLQLPVERVDAIVRLAGEAVAGGLGVGSVISERLGTEAGSLPAYSDLMRALDELQDEALRARMVTFEQVAGVLRRAVRDVAADGDKLALWKLSGGTTELDRHILELLRDPLLHLVRNAVDHGLEPPRERVAAGKPEEGIVHVRAQARGSEVLISVSDDGAGLKLDALRATAGPGVNPVEAIFRPGVSTATAVTGVSGRGVGLDAVRAAVAEVRGQVSVESNPGAGTTFWIAVPITLAVLPCLLARAGESCYAIPLQAAETVVDAGLEDEVRVEGRRALRVGEGLVGVSSLAETLGLGGAAEGPAVVLKATDDRHAFRVDELLGRREVVVNELGPMVPVLDTVAGAALEADGSVMLVLDPSGLVGRAAARDPATTLARPAPDGDEIRPRVLVVDDALTIRELQRSMLERAGYEVVVAVDGEAALARLADGTFDLVLTDVEMPNMDGFRLTREIRGHPQLEDIPVIMITSRGDEVDRRRGLDAGADRYIVKSDFDEQALLDAVKQMLETPE